MSKTIDVPSNRSRCFGLQSGADVQADSDSGGFGSSRLILFKNRSMSSRVNRLSIYRALADLGKPHEIAQVFAEFQRYL